LPHQSGARLDADDLAAELVLVRVELVDRLIVT
jgi:hypothetical protein